MSTQSQTPPTPKGPRNINRHNQKRSIPPPTQKGALVTTPPSSPPRNLSPGEATTDSSNNVNLCQKKHGRYSKKLRDAPRASPVQKNGHRYTSSHPNNTTTPQPKDSPHYAGPTFHASPAPSALPIPSFFSKSMPDSDIVPALEQDNDYYDAGPDLETTPSKPKQRPQIQNGGQESTPLDFLFKAAVEARNTQPQRSPESNSRIRSPQTDSKALQQRKADAVSNGMFPLEMDSPNSRNSQIGPSFATSYKERMNALRSASSPSPPMTDLDEDQRRAKTEALKNLLLNPRPQRPSFSSTLAHDNSSGITERSILCPTVPHFATPLRTTSGPPATTMPYHVPGEQRPLRRGNMFHPPTSQYPSSGGPLQLRTHNSAMRKEVLTSIPGNTGGLAGESACLPHVAHDPKLPNGYMHSCSPVSQQSTASRPMSASTSAQALDTKKMEDDIRRILKLDVNQGFPPNGIQSSYA
ncbi:hypothetical protein EYZ11_006799 [Aspergillus tanneri]|uniref:Uncharacterized protein n=1 Tax=Aspergillus tanneri TaxID=1220188 RepID=A0A4S3JEJ9_9EURO|nr:uncharacterized protein ATNIH1004_009910 [Aspergillus tanneri]KAA8643148.1 hypothetical protein ATNIH1004_009910 [Aspergillus tanneri]THC93723.1 hypothetical protein EYZ11_006799 [Aspergillus tanneri]